MNQFRHKARSLTFFHTQHLPKHHIKFSSKYNNSKSCTTVLTCKKCHLVDHWLAPTERKECGENLNINVCSCINFTRASIKQTISKKQGSTNAKTLNICSGQIFRRSQYNLRGCLHAKFHPRGEKKRKTCVNTSITGLNFTLSILLLIFNACTQYAFQS